MAKVKKKTVRKAAQEKGKVARIPFGTVRLKMQLSDDDMKEFQRRGKKTYWFNEQDGRIPRAKAGGYSFVRPEHATSLGQSAIHQGNTDEGSRVSMIVNKGGGPDIRAFLMEISIKDWKEDQKAKEAYLLENEKADPIEGGTDVGYGPGVTYSH
jgi:hypothetical protein